MGAAESPFRVKNGKAQSEQMSSGLPSITDMNGPGRHFRNVPLTEVSRCSNSRPCIGHTGRDPSLFVRQLSELRRHAVSRADSETESNCNTALAGTASPNRKPCAW